MRIEEIKKANDVYNPLKMLAHREKLEAILRGEPVSPVFVEVHPEAFCSNDCSFCAYRNSGWEESQGGMQFLNPAWAGDTKGGQTGKPKGKRIPGVSGWSEELTLRLPKQMADAGVKAVEVTGSGEPTLHPYIIPFFQRCADNGLDMALVTHGQNLSKEIVESIDRLVWVRFSLDACTPDVHSRVHGVPKRNFDLALAGITRMMHRHPNAYLGASFIVTNENWQQIYQAAEFYFKLGMNNIRYSFEYTPVGKEKITGENLKVARDEIRRAKADFDSVNFRVFGQTERLDTYSRPNDDFSFCFYELLVWNIGYDGKTYPCCILLYRPEAVFGDLNTQSFQEVVESESRKEYVDKFNVSSCPPCWLRNKNIVVETVLAPDARNVHKNFP